MISISSPQFSFVRFDTESLDTCKIGVDFCLPVFLEDDVAFQWLVTTDTAAEAAALCDASIVTVGLVRDCEQVGMDVTFVEKPEVIRVGEKQVIMNWAHGFPNFDAEYAIGECFKVRIEIDHPTAGLITDCSNCFERIAEDCYTSVLDYSSTQNIFGFNYCGSGELEVGGGDEQEACPEPRIVTFTNVASLNIPYTASMQALYGNVPTIEVYILDNGEYIKPVIKQGFNTYPPTMIIIDLGGPATGYVKIS